MQRSLEGWLKDSAEQKRQVNTDKQAGLASRSSKFPALQGHSTPFAAIVIALAVLLGPSSDTESVHCPGAAPQSTMADWTSASFRGDGDLLYMSAGLDESTPGAFDAALKC